MHVILVERYLVPKLAKAPSCKTLIMKEEKRRGKVSCSGGETRKAGVLKEGSKESSVLFCHSRSLFCFLNDGIGIFHLYMIQQVTVLF